MPLDEVVRTKGDARTRLIEYIGNAISPIERTVRERIVVQLVDDLMQTDTRLAAGLGETDEIGPLEFLTLAAAHLPARLVRHRDEVARFESFSAGHAAVKTPEARREAIRDHLIATVSDRRSLRGDLAAVDRTLDFDALRERHAGRLHAENIRDELLMSAIARTLERWMKSPSEPALLASMVADTRLDTALVEHARIPSSWRKRLVALKALARLAHALATEGLADTVDPTATRLAVDVAQQSSHNPWIQTAALDVLFAVAPATAEALAVKRILNRAAGPTHDFVTRRLFIELIFGHADSRHEDFILTAMNRDVDPSEHVQIGLCPLAASTLTPPALEFLCGRVAEGTWRVRLVAGKALCTIIQSAIEGEQRRVSARYAREALYRLLRTEADARALGPLLADVRGLFGTILAESSEAPALLCIEEASEILATRLRDKELPPSIHESISATMEAIDQSLRPQLREVHEALGPIVRGTPVGGARRVETDSIIADAPTQTVGRALAQLTREDFGVELVGKRRYRLFRGDRWALRTWRVLHELTHPAPNKRAAHPHLVGRRRRGHIRAHPAILDEITATVVPGERIRSEYEGGWGRHLPLVDDVLDLPVLGQHEVSLFSSHGVTRVLPPASVLRRLWVRICISVHYERLATLRRNSLDAHEPDSRARYVQTLRDRYAIGVEFTPYERTSERTSARDEAVESPHVRSLFARAGLHAPTIESAAWVAPGIPLIPAVEERIRVQADYFASMAGNGQVALALFVFVLIAWFLMSSFRKQRAIRLARQRIPLCIGGWGTRGKSGTERLKAALFSGLGYSIYSKTTGCEAMMLHCNDGEIPTEVFLFRPYAKATIWEHSTTLQQAAALGTEVFLWECMALNPRYVELLQLQWMRDDLSTITNTYPDHEDIQGPAGSDVAQVIAGFIPSRSKVVSAEVNFAPVLRQVAQERESEFVSLGQHEEAYLADDFLALFPYAEHPRNIALVRRVAVELGIDPDFATYVMAESVVPDIGVLKRFAPTRVAGRVLTFISGQSANERAGFMNNWRRMGCDVLDVEHDLDAFVITVVNNRADRISRSLIFAKILVNDIAADRHVLIGSNLEGLLSYIRDALDVFLSNLELVREHEIGPDEALDAAKARLRTLMARLRIPQPSTHTLVRRLSSWAANLGMTVPADTLKPLESALERWLAEPGAIEPPTAIAAFLAGTPEFIALFESLQPGVVPAGPPEVYKPTSPGELKRHLCRDAARMMLHARLVHRLERAHRREISVARFHREAADAYRALFMDSLDIEPDLHASGDSIVLRCAQAVPPGANAILMGSQNIKGTGLEFAYRWLALESVDRARRELLSNDAVRVADGLRILEGVEDLGLMGSGLARATLLELRERNPGASERARIDLLLARVEGVHRARTLMLSTKRGSARLDQVASWIEQSVDFLDAIGRTRRSEQVMRDLCAGRISHGRAALVMRGLTSRQKGGWLAKSMQGWLKR